MLSRRKSTVLKKIYEMELFCDVDVAFFVRHRKSGRLATYKSINHRWWPPTQEQIVSAQKNPQRHANTLQEHTYPIPLVLLPEDVKFGKIQDVAAEERKGVRQSSPDESHGSTKADVK